MGFSGPEETGLWRVIEFWVEKCLLFHVLGIFSSCCSGLPSSCVRGFVFISTFDVLLGFIRSSEFGFREISYTSFVLYVLSSIQRSAFGVPFLS